MSKKIKILYLVFVMVSIQPSCKTYNNDKSFQVDKYIKLGVPDLNLKWKSKEIKTCLEVLTKLKKQNFYTLPRKGSAKSGKVYKKIISFENRLNNNDKNELSYMLLNLLQLYEDNNLKRNPGYYHREHTGMLIYYLRYIYETTKRTSSALDTASDEIKELPQIKQYYAGIGSAHARTLSGILFYQSDSVALADDDMILLSETIVPLVKSDWNIFNQDSKNKLMPELKNISQNHRSKIIRKKYLELLKSLN